MGRDARIVPADAAAIDAAAARLRAGGLVAFPTETVYGLGARARDPRAVAGVFRAKGRPADHPLIVHLPDAGHLGAWCAAVPEAARRLADAFWPGPLTLVLPRAASVPDVVTGGQATVAVRVPGHPVARALARALGEGIAAPSANRFGRISPTRAEHVATEFADADLTILDGGPCEVGLESTILDLAGPRPRLLRPGRIGVGALAAVLGRPVASAEEGEGPRAPGRMASHYAPVAPTRLVARDAIEAGAAPADAGLLLCRAAAPAGHVGATVRLPDDAEAYGRGLYAALRELDAGGPSAVVIERPPGGDAWCAVHDRLRRAAGLPGPDAAAAYEEEP